jgi:hypothetical protein
MEIQVGTLLECETAVTMRALGGVVQGYDFPVVWVATPQDYARAQGNGDKPAGIPWPVTALRVLEDARDVA